MAAGTGGEHVAQLERLLDVAVLLADSDNGGLLELPTEAFVSNFLHISVSTAMKMDVALPSPRAAPMGPPMRRP